MTVKWGIIGCGSVAERCAPALSGVQNSELVGVMRRDIEKAADFARRHGAKRFYGTAEDLLADEEINAVYVATPPDSHAHNTCLAARAGMQVLCEKPMAMTVDEGRRMIDACAEAGVQLMIAYYRRYWPVARKMKELLDAGVIGPPVFARTQCSFLYSPPTNGALFWRTDPKAAGGGFLWDIGSHRLDLLTGLLGDVTAVSAFVETQTFDFDVDDSSAILLRFANGARGVGLFNWNVAASVDEFEISGSEGRLLARNLQTGKLTLVSGKSERHFDLPPPQCGQWGLVEEFVDAVESGRPNTLSGEEGLKTNRIIDAACRSSREGRLINIEGE